MKESIFQKIEKKTNINKETILALANKLQKNDINKEESIREVIQDISNLTGKEVSEAQIKKILDTIQKDKVPKNIDNMF